MKTVFFYLVLLIIPFISKAFEEGDSIAYKRNFWFYSQRWMPGDSIPAGAMESAIDERDNIRGQGFFLNSVFGSWANIGPAPLYGGLSGRINFVKYANPNTLIIGAPNGGIWKTTDLNVWTFMDPNGQLKSNCSGAIAIDNTANPPVIYYGTGEGVYGFEYTYSGIGIYKTTDWGESWINCSNGLPKGLRVFRITIRPNHASEIFAATSMGLYRSLDAGANWIRIVPESGNPKQCNDIVFSYQSDNIAFLVGPKEEYFNGTGFMKSENGGINFTALTGTGFTPNGRSHIAICEYDDNFVYAITDNGNVTVYRSTDRCTTFTDPKTLPTATQGGYNMFVNIKPGNKDVAYFGGVQMFKTSNFGASYCQVTGQGANCDDPCGMHDDYHNFDFNTNDPSDMAVTNDGGIWYTTNSGTVWHTLSNSSLSISLIYRIHSGNNLLAGVQDNGVGKKDDGNSTNWTALLGQFDGGTIINSKYNPGLAYGILMPYGDFLYKEGSSYIALGSIPGKFNTAGADWLAPLVEHPTESGKLFTARRNAEVATQIDFLKSTNAGLNWSTVGSVSGNCAPQCIAYSTDPQIIYMSSSGYYGDPPFDFGRGLFKSENGGVEWTTLIFENNPNIIPWRYISRVVTAPADNPENPDEVYITLSGFYYPFTNDGHIFKSTDGGNTWHNKNGNLPDAPINDIIYWYSGDCVTSSKNLAVATDVGVFNSTDGGDTWKELANNFPLAPVMDIEYVPFPNVMRAATFGRGVWEVSLGPTYITTEIEPFDNVVISNDDIIICSGGKLKLRDGQTVQMAANKKIIVNDGGEVEVSSGIAHFTGTNWGGIEIHENGVWNVSSAQISGSTTPMTIEGIGGNSYNTLNIDNVHFLNAGPVVINNRSDVNVTNCTFEYYCTAPENMPVCAVACNGSDNIIIQYNLIKTTAGLSDPCLMSSTAISVNYGANISIQNNTITNISDGISVSNSSPFVYNNIINTTEGLNANIGISLDNSYSATIKQNEINNCANGIILFMSSPVLYQNEIINGSNGEYSLQNLYGSYPRLHPTITEDETIWDGGDNVLLSTNSGSSILFSCNPYPDINYGCNHIDGYVYYITSGISSCSPGEDFYAYYNTWGSSPPNPAKFNMGGWTPLYEPDGCFESPPGGSHIPLEAPPLLLIVNYGNNIYDTIHVISSSRELPEDQDLYGTSIRNELTGNYTLAVTGFKQIIQNYQDSLTALNSLRHIMYCTDRINYSPSLYSNLRSYYLGLVSANPIDTYFVHVADELATKCLVRIEQFSNAINEYEEVISESNDSLQILAAELNVIETYMIMQNNENAKLFTGKYVQLKPVNVIDGFRMIREKLFKKHDKLTNTNIPVKFSLSQNYPNPFNPITKINYAIPRKSNVIMKIYDILGRLVRTLVDETKYPGYYTVTFDGTNLASGVYFYRIEAGNYNASKKMVLVK